MARTEPAPAASYHIGACTARRLDLTLAGRLDARGTAFVWRAVMDAVVESGATFVSVDATGVSYLDGAGVALLARVNDRLRDHGGRLEISGLSDDLRQMVNAQLAHALPRFERGDRRGGLVYLAGAHAAQTARDIRDIVEFVGELFATLVVAMRHPSTIRVKDMLLSCGRVGVDSLLILVLMGFLMGLILSFQSATSLQRFGAEIFVPNMLGLVMFREMGPLVTAVLLAARSGSAFAAEIGTMKVNEEIDALTTMGLPPVRFLVLPKVLSAMIMVPFMTMFFNFASLLGGAVVMLSLGYPLATFTGRVFSMLTAGDLVGGLFKAMVFSLLVAGVGCMRGLHTQSGASAVGDSTTSAVVSGIILIAVFDGIFAVVFYLLGV